MPIKALILSVLISLGIVSSEAPITPYNAELSEETAVMNAPDLAFEPIVEDVATSTDLCSCVRYTKSLMPSLPLLDAKDIKPNGEPQVGGAALFRYSNGVDHVAYITELLDIGFRISEANYVPCATSTRIIEWNNRFIRGFVI